MSQFAIFWHVDDSELTTELAEVEHDPVTTLDVFLVQFSYLSLNILNQNLELRLFL